VVAISPILLYIGMLIGAQAFQETPRSHAPAIVLALTPHLAAWGKLPDRQRARRRGHQRRAVGSTSWARWACSTTAWRCMGGGAILGGLVLGAIAVCVIDRHFAKAGGFALAGAALTFFGFMHGEKIGIAQSPTVAVSYLVVAGILFACARYATVTPPAPEKEEPIPHGAVAGSAAT
jgi:AGZA family xanthine/uracil permease-like MFS transporter